MKRFLATWSFALLMAIIAALPASAFRSGWEAERQKVSACFDQAYADPALQGLFTRLAVLREPTLAQLADDGLATDADIAAVRARDNSVRGCRAMNLAAVSKYHPYLRPAYEIRYFQSDVVLVQFIQRRITYGNANMLLKQAHLDFVQREARYFQALSDAQRRAEAESLSDIARRSQNPQIPGGSGRLTCRWVGATLYCDPY